MLRRTVCMWLANHEAISDYKEQFTEAIRKTSLNLKYRHDICILKDIQFYECTVEITVDYPSTLDDLPNTHFKGISQYLLKHYPDIFKNKRNGKRLLWFYQGPVTKIHDSEPVYIHEYIEEENGTNV